MRIRVTGWYRPPPAIALRLSFRRLRTIAGAGASSMQAGALFRPGMADETNLRGDETIFRTREGRLKRALGIRWLTKTTGPPRPMAGDSHDQGTFRNRNRSVHRRCSYR